MNNIIEEVVRNAHHLLEKINEEPITKTNPYLCKVLGLCVTNREIIGRIPAQDAGYLGFAFKNILDLTDEPSVFQTYSSICFYFLEKALKFGYVDAMVNTSMHLQTLSDAIIIMNIGARSLCRTFAQAKGIQPSFYIDFNNLDTLPIYVKQILLCEYSYFIEFEKLLETRKTSMTFNLQMYQRYNYLKRIVGDGYFLQFGSNEDLYLKAIQIRHGVYSYVAAKIESGDILFA